MPIKEHATKILTPYAFELLQREVKYSLTYALMENSNGSQTVRHSEKSSGGRIVSWVKEDESISVHVKNLNFLAYYADMTSEC